MADKDLPFSKEKSASRDLAFGTHAGTNIRMSKGMKAGLVTRALIEKTGESALIRRLIRNGAALEGFDTTLW